MWVIAMYVGIYALAFGGFETYSDCMAFRSYVQEHLFARVTDVRFGECQLPR